MNTQPSTQRLYYTDSGLLEFTATVQTCTPYGEHWAVTLDRTAFYPTGGGQPHDTGQLGQAQVIDCLDQETQIWHIVDQPLSGSVTGVIAAPRRRDHLQQHTGQHILSQAFIQIANAPTVGFHLGQQSCTIDLEIGELPLATIRQAEALANQIIVENRPITVHLTDQAGLAQFQLRKDTPRASMVRLIEVADFDISPCGGTHARQTGEIGAIVIRQVEKMRKMWRIEFLCGQRVIQDYQELNTIVRTLSAQFSAPREQLLATLTRLQTEQRQYQKQIQTLQETLWQHQAQQLRQSALINAHNVALVYQRYLDQDLAALKSLARHLLTVDATTPMVALLVNAGPQTTQVILAASPTVSLNCGQLITTLCQATGGRGGGRPDNAQGGWATTDPEPPALAALWAQLQTVATV
jgi:alanyl-tRNA synthetase